MFLPTLYQFDYQKFIRVLLLIAGILLTCHLGNMLAGNPSWQLERLFNLDLEGNLPTWFSSTLWLLASFIAYPCFKLVQDKRGKRAWAVIVLGLIGFSIDEVAKIHESLFSVTAKYVFPKVFEYKIGPMLKITNWSILASPFLILVVIWLLLTLKHLLKDSAHAAWLLVVGLSATIVGGWGLELMTNFLNHRSLQWVLETEVIFEECLEMVGSILIISGLSNHLRILQNRLESQI